jgi:outer membrane protein assembly factor BamB
LDKIGGWSSEILSSQESSSVVAPNFSPIISIFLALFSVSVFADDWPHWNGPKNDGRWHETDIIDEFPQQGPSVIWRKSIGSGYAGPSVVGDRLFVMDRTIPVEPVDEKKDGTKVENNIRAAGEIPGGERIRCLDAKTGEEVWSHTYDCPYKIAYPTGPRCTPTVDGDQVYCLGAMGKLVCLTTRDGKILWEKELTKVYDTKPPIWGYASHPIVDGGNVIVPVGGKGSGVVALNKDHGRGNLESRHNTRYLLFAADDLRSRRNE